MINFIGWDCTNIKAVNGLLKQLAAGLFSMSLKRSIDYVSGRVVALFTEGICTKSVLGMFHLRQLHSGNRIMRGTCFDWLHYSEPVNRPSVRIWKQMQFSWDIICTQTKLFICAWPHHAVTPRSILGPLFQLFCLFFTIKLSILRFAIERLSHNRKKRRTYANVYEWRNETRSICRCEAPIKQCN